MKKVIKHGLVLVALQLIVMAGLWWILYGESDNYLERQVESFEQKHPANSESKNYR